MDSGYTRAKALFIEALAWPLAERAERLNERCRGDQALYDEVEKLLRHAPKAESTTADEELPPPPSIDGYRLLRSLGRGGMGQVWLGERLDPAFSQLVAVKLLAIDLLLDRDAIARFQIERQILARLDHPHIARLIDGGELANRSPYLVMEYVEGESIDCYCQRNELSTAARIALLVSVAKAVQAAHRQLVVHRDLKPGNILVDHHGEPKLLDFGIAKLLDRGGQQSTDTGTGLQRLTPRYAAPEQVRAEAVTTATDVYAFGVLMYELLSGASPYAHHLDAPLRLAQVICDYDPAMPSAACTTPVQRQALQGDLDAIVLKCMRKQAAERYPDMQAVVADLQAWQRGEAVDARRGDRYYRLRRQLWRHRIAVSASALITALTVGFVIQLGRQVTLVEHQAERAEAERAKAEQVTQFMVDLFKNADPSKALGAKLTVRQALDQGVAELQRHLEDQPEVKSYLLRELAEIYAELGEREEAVQLADSAVALIESERDRYPLVWLRALYTRAAEVDQFKSSDEQSLRRVQSLIAEARRQGERRIELQALNQLGLEWAHRRDYERALGLYAEVRDGLLALLKLSGVELAPKLTVTNDNRDLLQQLAKNSHNRCRTLLAAGNLIAAHSACTDAANLKARLWPANHPLQISTQMTLAEIAGESGDLPAAIAAESVVLEQTRALYGDGHVRSAYAEVNLGTSLKQAKRYAEAVPLLEHALLILEQELGKTHRAYLLTLNNYANLIGNQGDWTRSLTLHQQVLELRKQVFGPDSVEVAQSLLNRANAEKGVGLASLALDSTTGALAIYRHSLGREHPDTLRALANLAAKQLDVGRSSLAASTASQLLDEQDPEQLRPDVRLQARFVLAQALWREHQPAEALRAAAMALADAKAYPSELISVEEIQQWIARRKDPSTVKSP